MLGGGTEKVLLTFLQNFDYIRFDVELLLLYNIGLYLNDIPQHVKVRFLYSKPYSFREKIDYNLFSRFGLLCGYKQCIRFKISKHYDTIISFQEGFTLPFHSYVLSRANKNVSWVHTDIYNNHHRVGFLTSEAEQKAYSSMDEIIFVSNDAKSQFEKLFPNNAVLKTVVLNPIDYDYISNYRKEYSYDSKDKCFEIVAVGRLVQVKAYDRLICLAKRLREDNYNFHVTIIGEGEECDKLECLIAEYGLQNYVSLPGFLKPPYSKMADADLFVSTSFAEGFSLVLCEAFCLGLPVVSTKTTGPIELIDNNRYGILVDHDNESIYQGVKRMIDDKELRLHYHQMSLERAKMFNIKDTIKQVYEVL